MTGSLTQTPLDWTNSSAAALVYAALVGACLFLFVAIIFARWLRVWMVALLMLASVASILALVSWYRI